MVKPMHVPQPVEEHDLAERLAARLDPLHGMSRLSARSDYDLGPNRPPDGQTLTPAAVLAPIVRRPAGWTMLFTERAADLPHHPGQISFPGGRVQPDDEGPVGTALREAEEELGLCQGLFAPIGGLEPWVTGTGFRILPVVAYLEPGFVVRPDPREVASVFEAPLSFLFDPANHEVREAEWRGAKRRFYAMPYEGHYIWGATAGMIRALYERLYG
jgi:8-oxo-dGTP pyrophosphatase MutT (NUDIX family)